MTASLLERVRHWQGEHEGSLPFPGAGLTANRHLVLRDVGRQDLSVARIVEAHTDALAILEEARLAPRSGALYGVWAADGPQGRMSARLTDDGRWCLDGMKQYCSGATFVDAALVTAHTPAGVVLFDVPLRVAGVQRLPTTWASPAFADTDTGPVAFDAVLLEHGASIGGPNWYLDRPGFWHGAIGPAACWAGGALSLVEPAAAAGRRDVHCRAHVGAMQATAWGIEAVLRRAGDEIDADPADAAAQGRIRALMSRHLIERGCTEIADRFGRVTGPQLLAYNAHIVRQHQSLLLYIRQCHGERDLETIPPP